MKKISNLDAPHVHYWKPTANLRWIKKEIHLGGGMAKQEKVLQQKFIGMSYLNRIINDSYEWRDVPTE